MCSTVIFQAFGFLPEGFHQVNSGCFQWDITFGQLCFDITETAHEFIIGRPQQFFGRFPLAEPCEIGDGKQDIPQFLVCMILIPLRHGLLVFCDFLFQFGHNIRFTGPVKMDFCRFFLDLLRPIEVYRDSPIFYSLGDFALELYSVEFAPQEFFEKYGLNAATTTVHELLKARSKNFTRGLMEDRRMFLAVIPLWETDNGKLSSLRLMPVEAMMKGNKSEIGLPRRSDGKDIAEYLGEMCKPYGTKIVLEDDGILTVTW